MTLVHPALSFNFLVTMWEVQGPGMFGVDHGAGGWGAAARIASGLVNTASQILIGAFSEVGGLAAEIEMESYQAGGENSSPKKFAKRGRYPNLTFKRGITFNADLWDWNQQVLHGVDPVLRKSGIILLLERGGFAQTGSSAAANLFVGLTRPPIAAWYFERALPERVIGPPLEAKTNTVAIETLELSHEGLTRVSLGMIPGLADAASSMGGLLGTAASAAAASASFAVGHIGSGPDIGADPPRPPPGAGDPTGGG